MRQDPKLHDFLMREKAKERESACCVRNDDSGCIQTSAGECSVRKSCLDEIYNKIEPHP